MCVHFSAGQLKICGERNFTDGPGPCKNKLNKVNFCMEEL